MHRRSYASEGTLPKATRRARKRVRASPRDRRIRHRIGRVALSLPRRLIFASSNLAPVSFSSCLRVSYSSVLLAHGNSPLFLRLLTIVKFSQYFNTIVNRKSVNRKFGLHSVHCFMIQSAFLSGLNNVIFNELAVFVKFLFQHFRGDEQTFVLCDHYRAHRAIECVGNLKLVGRRTQQ